MKKIRLGVALGTAVATAAILIPGAASAAGDQQPARPCSTESGMASVSYDRSTTITFVNNTANPVNVYWLNYSGQRVLYYGGLPAGASYTQGTYASHPWVVTDAGNTCLAVFMGVGHPTVATVN